MLFYHIKLDGQDYYNNMCHTNLHFSVCYVFELNVDPKLFSIRVVDWRPILAFDVELGNYNTVVTTKQH